MNIANAASGQGGLRARRVDIRAIRIASTDVNQVLQPAQERKHMPTRSDLLVAALDNEGVHRIIDIPGEENLDFVESLRKSSSELGLTRHEQAAAFMAA